MWEVRNNNNIHCGTGSVSRSRLLKKEGEFSLDPFNWRAMWNITGVVYFRDMIYGYGKWHWHLHRPYSDFNNYIYTYLCMGGFMRQYHKYSPAWTPPQSRYSTAPSPQNSPMFSFYNNTHLSPLPILTSPWWSLICSHWFQQYCINVIIQ